MCSGGCTEVEVLFPRARQYKLLYYQTILVQSQSIHGSRYYLLLWLKVTWEIFPPLDLCGEPVVLSPLRLLLRWLVAGRRILVSWHPLVDRYGFSPCWGGVWTDNDAASSSQSSGLRSSSSLPVRTY